MIELNKPYITINEDGKGSYGGRQQSSGDAVISRCGCGVIAAMDTLLYMSHCHADCKIAEFAVFRGTKGLDRGAYYSCVKLLNRRYFPLLPPFGMNGLTLMCGMNAFFANHRLPFTALWGISREKLWDRIGEMLSADIPVVLSVGPNFPRFWQEAQVSLYRRTDDGHYNKAAAAKGHYVVATGLDPDWVHISSWGQSYYLNRLEYQHYADLHSTNLLSNVLYIRHK